MDDALLSQLINKTPSAGRPRKLLKTARHSILSDLPIIHTTPNTDELISRSESIIPEQSLSRDFEEVLKNEKLADVTLLVNDKSYRAHKVILAARSRIFAYIFESQKDDVLTITDLKTEVMDEVLRYIYTGKPHKLDQLAKDLVDAANKYDLEGLKTMCGKSLLKTISLFNAIDLWIFAHGNGVDKLKRDVVQFIVANFDAIMKTEKWKGLELDARNFKMMKEICEAFSQRQISASEYSHMGIFDS